MSAPQNADYSTWDIVKATQYGIISRCKELVEAGLDVRAPDAENITLLHWAAINNRIDIAKYYISVGAIVDVLGGDLMATPLHWAVREGHLQMVIALMQYGQADPNVRDAEGCAAIHVAVQHQFTHIAAYLIAKGVDPDLFDSNGKTPLMWAAWRTYGMDPTRTLLSLHASPNLKDRVQHNTPVHFACLSQNTTVLQQLLVSGAEPNAKNGKGQTPLDIAMAKQNVWMTARLKQALREKGIDKSSHYCWDMRFSEVFRKRTTFILSFFAMFFIGYIFQLEASTWLLKLLMFAAVYIVVYGVIILIMTGEEVNNVLPICISISTKFWVYMTCIFMYWQFIYSTMAQLFLITFTPAMFYFFYKAMMTDPGIISSPEEDKKRIIIRLAENNNLRMDRLCNTCMIMKPLRSKHCAVLNRCIAKFDHYCPWVYNCIGANNHKYFIYYLFFLFWLLIWHVYAAYQYWTYSCWEASVISNMEKLSATPTCAPWVMWITVNCALHALWVLLLLSCQLYQVLVLGVTTNERMNAARYAHFRTSEHGQLQFSPFNRGFIKNTADFFGLRCFGWFHPLHTDWRTKMTFNPEYPLQHHNQYEDV